MNKSFEHAQICEHEHICLLAVWSATRHAALAKACVRVRARKGVRVLKTCLYSCVQTYSKDMMIFQYRIKILFWQQISNIILYMHIYAYIYIYIYIYGT